MTERPTREAVEKALSCFDGTCRICDGHVGSDYEKAGIIIAAAYRLAQAELAASKERIEKLEVVAKAAMKLRDYPAMPPSAEIWCEFASAVDACATPATAPQKAGEGKP